MLVSLYIKDYALISEQRIEFGTGLNIISGETGAGKSILLGALDLVLGGRATTDMVRTGSLRSIVEAEFVMPEGDKGKRLEKYLDHHGIAVEDYLVLKREIRQEGKGRGFLCGQQVPGSMLKEIRRFLIDIHGQNEHQNILSVNNHRFILDSFCKNDSHTKKLRSIYKKLEGFRQQYASLILSEEEKQRSLELLNHQIDELEAANLDSEDELSELEKKNRLYENAEQYARDLSQVLYALSEREPSLTTEINKIEKLLESHVSFDSEIEPIFHNLRDTYFALEEVAHGLRRRLDSLQFNEEEVQLTRERFDLLQGIVRKYGGSIKNAKSTLIDCHNRKAGIELSAEQSLKLKTQIEELSKEQEDLALSLSELRKSGATSLDNAIQNELADLAMKQNRIKTSIKWQRKPDASAQNSDPDSFVIGPEGFDIVEFLLAANVNESLRPLRKIASGGEMSRIMLALKKVTIDTDPVETMIFDEVDAGIGGAVAEAVGTKLKSLAAQSQVIVITHLPQIASMSGSQTTHFRVEKDTEKGSRIRRLSGKERVTEIARMLAGTSLTDSAIQHAQRLLEDGSV